MLKRQLEEAWKIKLEHPDAEEHGDFSSNAALKSGGGRKAAEEMAEKLQGLEMVEKVEVAGPGFLNIWLQTDVLIKELHRVLTEAEDYGKTNLEDGKTVVVEYSSPNIAKRFGIGHFRSTIIGQALYNLYASLGAKTIGDNHLGDWGTQFGKLLYMLSQHRNESLNLDMLEKWYVEFHQHPEWEDEGRIWFKKLEEGEAEARQLWAKCVQISMEEFDKLYRILGIKIDNAYGESFYEEEMKNVVSEAKEKGIAISSQGALVIEILGINTPLMLIKSDGTTTYAARDLATIRFRIRTWQPAVIVYEVGNEQSLHFQQVFAAAKLLGYVNDSTELVHTRHGLYLNPDGKKFSTRKGDTVKLEEVLSEAIERAKALGNTDEDTAKAVGIGAVKFFDVSHSVQSDIVFEWEKVMALEGKSGPYLQYTIARINSVLEKAKFSVSSFQFSKNNSINQYSNEEMRILRFIYRFPEVIEEAAYRYSPNLVANYLYELAQRFNAFYNQHQIIKAESEEVKDFRLVLSAATGQVLKNGLRLLGIDTPERL